MASKHANVGSILSVLPEISPEGTTIHLTLAQEYVCEPEWRDYGGQYVDSNGNKQTAKMTQPFFHTYTASTTVSIHDGSTILIGGGMPSRGGKKVVFVFVTARLVDMDGKPLRKKK